MPKVNRYVDIDTVEREAKKDFIDRHSPFIYCDEKAKKGEKFPVRIVMGKEYTHPDDPDHYIESIRLFDGERLIGEATFTAGMLGGEGCKGNAEVTFNIVPMGKKMNLVAQAYCTKHGLWESEVKEVNVTE